MGLLNTLQDAAAVHAGGQAAPGRPGGAETEEAGVGQAPRRDQPEAEGGKGKLKRVFLE